MDVDPRLREALKGRYTLGSRLGTGGMATVWRARDERHGRPVAIKVLHEGISQEVGAERFLQEIRITASLNHPHVLPLLDSGEAEGLLYSVMPLVAGASLRGLLEKEGQLPLDQVVHIIGQVASALDHAHRQGVVHRDVKPENILFSEGLAVVSDFGIARAMSLAGPQHLTRTGFGLGTLGYMSPEQAAGREDIDERADVFGLAAVAYEMIVGSTPGGWMTDDAVRVGRYLDAAQAHREVLDSLPGRVEQTLVKGLAVRPADRHASPGSLADDLATAARGTKALTEAQVQEVLRRATELELEEEEEVGVAALTLGSVEQVAAEVGISPTKVRRAAQELTYSGTAPPPAPRKKGSEYLYADGVARGEMDESDHESIVHTIQGRLGILGHVTVLGSTLTWSPANPGDDARKIVVRLTSEGGATHVHAEERLELAGWRMMIPPWGAMGVMIPLLLIFTLLGLDIDKLVPLILVGGIGGGFSSVFGYFKIMGGKRSLELDEVVEDLRRVLDARHSEDESGETPRLPPS